MLQRVMTVLTVIATIALLGLTATPTLAKQEQSLPPGLQKKVEQGKPLPPGWQKRYHKGDILESDIFARGKIVVPIDKEGLITVNIEGSLFRLHEKTRQIVSILSE